MKQLKNPSATSAEQMADNIMGAREKTHAMLAKVNERCRT